MSTVAIQSLPSGANDARRIASLLDISMLNIELHRFPDGELLVTTGPATSTTIIYAPLDRPNDKLIALLSACDTLRRGGAKRLVLVAPYLCYMRQDVAFRPGEAISQRVIGRLLAGIFDRVITVDAHLHRTTDIKTIFPGIEVDNLSAMPAIADALRTAGVDSDTVVVGPDAESEPWVSDLAARLGMIHSVARKTRRGDRSVEITLASPQVFKDRPVLLIDDIVSSGGTLIACAKALVAAGARSIDVIVTHALFPPELRDEMLGAGVRSIRSTHTVPHPSNAITLDAIIAAALRSELSGAEAMT
jgi:ribose-phosphate pyrophosphokinase